MGNNESVSVESVDKPSDKNNLNDELSELSAVMSQARDKNERGDWKKLIGIGMDKHELLRQFVFTLEAEVESYAHESGEDTDRQQKIKILKQDLRWVREHYSNDDAWSTAYKIEKRLIEFYSDKRALLEFQRRVEEAKRADVPFKDYYVSLLNDPPSDVAVKDKVKDALMLLVTDLQWFYNRRYVRQRYAKYTLQRVTLIFLASFFTFFLVIYFFAGKFDQVIDFQKHTGAQ